MTHSEHRGVPGATHPLVYLACELRVPFSPRLAAQASVEQLVEQLPNLPVLREDPRQQFSALAEGGLEWAPAKAWRLTDLNSTRSVVLTATSVLYETTRYAGFDAFKVDFDEILAAVQQVCAPVGYDRLGLRYVNEVRPTGLHSKFEHWSRSVAGDYIDALTAAERAVQNAYGSDGDPAAHAGPAAAPTDDQDSWDGHADHPDDDSCKLQAAETILRFSLPGNAGMIIKLANLDGPGIVGNAPLRRYQIPEPGPFFLVDFDGFWPLETSEIRSFDRAGILDLLYQVHAPVKSMFRWATTATYREESGVVNQ